MSEVWGSRYFVSRSSLFLNQWLMSRMGEEISPQETFARFKSYVEHEAGHKMADLLLVLKEQARLYEAWTLAAARPSGNLNTVEMAVYRMHASGIELLKPILIWLHEPGRTIPQPIIDRIVTAAESWVIRRQLLRLSGSNLGRVVAEVIKTYANAPVDELADRVITHLARLNVTSTYWPGDDEIRTALLAENAYRRFPRPRLRAFLEAIENSYRAETGQPQVERAGFPIEHILPQKWREEWAVRSLEDEQQRQERVHRLGNLTLLTSKLNAKVSNGPWSSKRSALLQHNTIKLTGRLVEQAQDWNEASIDRRTAEMVDVLLRTWPVPTNHQGTVTDPQTKSSDWVELKQLLAAGLLQHGQKLIATPQAFAGTEAELGKNGHIHIDGKSYSTPSGAAYSVRRRATNGWHFWSVEDGRRLRDVRTEFLAAAEVGKQQAEDPPSTNGPRMDSDGTPEPTPSNRASGVTRSNRTDGETRIA